MCINKLDKNESTHISMWYITTSQRYIFRCLFSKNLKRILAKKNINFTNTNRGQNKCQKQQKTVHIMS